MSKFNFEDSDCKTMELWEKGRILALHRAKKTLQEIAQIATRSVDWCTNIVGALQGSDIEPELIRRWEEKDGELEKVYTGGRKAIVGGKSTTGRKVVDGGETERTHNGRLIAGTETRSGKGDNFGRAKKRISRTVSKGYRVRNERKTNGRRPQLSNTTDNTNIPIINKVRKSKDYVGE